jgi:hypothetical protein
VLTFAAIVGRSLGTAARFVDYFYEVRLRVTTAILENPSNQILAQKNLIKEELWNRLVSRIVFEEAIARSLAERIMDQALAFLKLCAQNPDGPFSPSPLVDIGWHTFILYTREYASFCAKMGKFIHHEPYDIDGVDYGNENISLTVNALREQHFMLDEPLWLLSSSASGRDTKCGIKCVR